MCHIPVKSNTGEKLFYLPFPKPYGRDFLLKMLSMGTRKATSNLSKRAAPTQYHNVLMSGENVCNGKCFQISKFKNTVVYLGNES